MQKLYQGLLCTHQYVDTEGSELCWWPLCSDCPSIHPVCPLGGDQLAPGVSGQGAAAFSPQRGHACHDELSRTITERSNQTNWVSEAVQVCASLTHNFLHVTFKSLQ